MNIWKASGCVARSRAFRHPTNSSGCNVSLSKHINDQFYGSPHRFRSIHGLTHKVSAGPKLPNYQKIVQFFEMFDLWCTILLLSHHCLIGFKSKSGMTEKIGLLLVLPIQIPNLTLSMQTGQEVVETVGGLIGLVSLPPPFFLYLLLIHHFTARIRIFVKSWTSSWISTDRLSGEGESDREKVGMGG